jgi:hypothetical protein
MRRRRRPSGASCADRAHAGRTPSRRGRLSREGREGAEDCRGVKRTAGCRRMSRTSTESARGTTNEVEGSSKGRRARGVSQRWPSNRIDSNLTQSTRITIDANRIKHSAIGHKYQQHSSVRTSIGASARSQQLASSALERESKGCVHVQ